MKTLRVVLAVLVLMAPACVTPGSLAELESRILTYAEEGQSADNGVLETAIGEVAQLRNKVEGDIESAKEALIGIAAAITGVGGTALNVWRNRTRKKVINGHGGAPA
jgi:hypothetical protein